MPRTITVKGIGKVSTKPDLVVLSLEMVSKDKEYDKAMDSAAEQLAQLNECLATIGFEKE